MSISATIVILIGICIVSSILGTGLKAFFRRGMVDKPPEFPGGEERLNRAILLKSLRGWISMSPLLFALIYIDDSMFSGSSSVWIFLLVLGAFLLNYALEWLLNRLSPSQKLADLKEWEDERLRRHVGQIEMRGDNTVPSDGVGRPKDLN